MQLLSGADVGRQAAAPLAPALLRWSQLGPNEIERQLTMASATWALQRSVHAALIGDTELVGLLGGSHVFDHVPRGTALPYMTFGASFENDWSTAEDIGHELLFSLNVWTEALGRKQAEEIMTAVRRVLHDQSLPVSGFRLINLRHESSDLIRLSDGETLQGVVRLRATLETTA